MPDASNPLSFLLNVSASTPIDALVAAVGQIIKPITDSIDTKRETMSQESRDRYDLLEYSIWENIFVKIGLVRVDQLRQPPASTPLPKGITVVGQG